MGVPIDVYCPNEFQVAEMYDYQYSLITLPKLKEC